MIGSQDYVDDHLEDWSDIQDGFEDCGLLIGNGASCAVWDKFKYVSLFEKAQSTDAPYRLSSKDISVFEAMETKDFERVLAALWTTKTVCKALNQDSQTIREIRKRYKRIQRALIETINAVHVPWIHVSEEVLPKIHNAVLPYSSIYSTNYDLLLYWAIMTENPPIFKDYFWADGSYFDIANTNLRDERRRILYLHGALHLVTLPFGSGTRKLTAATHNLLDQFGRSLDSGETPLFVTEGNSNDKLASIRNSDYLLFAYEQFANHEGNLVIFGHSLGDSDTHLIDAMKDWKAEDHKLAVSIYERDPERIMEHKIKLRKDLPKLKPNMLFFDARTHPLGRSDLRTTGNGDNNP